MTKEDLKAFAADLGIFEIGVSTAADSQELRQILKKNRTHQPPCPFEESDAEKRCDPTLALPGAQSVVSCLFPYYSAKIRPENLSRYACVRDYHSVAAEKLEQIAAFIEQETGSKCICFADNGPLCDRWLAYRAGLGFFGQNRMLINPRLGSFFFIGSVLTTAEFVPDVPLANRCIECGKCIKACPGGALGENEFHYERCISYITQAKELTQEQVKLLCAQEKIYGCDVCQEVCPHNAELTDTIMPEFADGYLTDLPCEDVKNLSNREFRKKYAKFPFSWRGKKPLARNLQQKELDKIRD